MFFSQLRNKFIYIFFLTLFADIHFASASKIDRCKSKLNNIEDRFKQQIALRYETLNKNLDIFENGASNEGSKCCSNTCATLCCLPCVVSGIVCSPCRKKETNEVSLRKTIKDDLRNLRNFINGEHVKIGRAQVKVSNSKLMSTLQEEFNDYIKKSVDVVSYRSGVVLFQTEYNWKSFLFNQETVLEKSSDIKTAGTSEFLDEVEQVCNEN